MRISRRSVFVALLVAGVMLSFYAILISGRPEAQEDEGCADPQTVDTFNGTENQRTRPFNITGTTFRLRYDLTDLDEDPGFDSFTIRPFGEDGIGVPESVLVFDPGAGSQNILEGPETFTLEIESDGFEYSVAVDDCTGTAPGNREGSSVEASQPIPTVQNKNKDRAKKVERNTIPKRPLPPTDGIPASYAVYGFVLGGTSLLALGLVRRGR